MPIVTGGTGFYIQALLYDIQFTMEESDPAYRQELAEYSGLSVKTVNRAVKKFEEQGLISRSGKTFYIDEGQYEQLHALVSKLIEPLIERGRNDEPDL